MNGHARLVSGGLRWLAMACGGLRWPAVARGGPRSPAFAYKARLKSLLSARESSGRLELLLCRSLVIVNPN